MAITSHQINQMMAGQQGMFGNNATYAQQISPMGQASGMAPTYANPYGPMASPGTAEFNQGMAAAPGMYNAAASYGAPIMMGAGMMMGGRAGAMMDPMTAGMRGFGRGVGWQSGAGISSNMGAVARGGIGGIAKGIGGAAMYAAPVMAMYAAGKYAFGQMSEGAQFQNQVSASLQNNFRFTNDQSRTGYGFGQMEQRQIGRMLNQMGSQDMMTTPQELLGIMNQGAAMGQFRGVQDAREFKQKFTQMKESLTEIAKTFNTTLSEAVPFFQSARQQGFWTPQDITKHATQVRQTQANTGMSARQAQAVMGMGAQMARSIGGTGQQGAEMMARAQQVSGAALFGGVVSSRQLGEAGFGTGAEGAQNLGTMLAGATTRFARSRVGRWALASMMNKEGTGLDEVGLAKFTSGAMSVGEMSRRARRNVSGGRAYQFVENEGELRGQLAQRGPEAAMGIVRSLTGSRLYGGSGRDKLITRRIIQRFMGGNKRQAEIVAKMAREMPRMMAIQAARSEGALDAQERQGEQQMQDTYEGFKRKIGGWWEKNISGPLKEAGADFSYRVGKTWQRFTDRLFGTTGRGVGLSPEAVRSMVRSAITGNRDYMTETMGDQGMVQRELGGGFGGMGMSSAKQMMRMGFGPSGIGKGMGGIFGSPFSLRFRQSDVRQMQALGRASRGVTGDEEAAAIGYGGADEMRTAMGGAGAKQIQQYMRSGEMLALRGRSGGIMGTYGDMDQEEQEEYTKKVLTRIRSGRAGEQARKMFEGLNERQAMGRLQAMQGQARGGFTGMGGIGGLNLREGQDLRTAVEERQVETVEDLAKQLRGGVADSWLAGSLGQVVAASQGGLQGVPVTEQGLEELKKDPRGEQAMRAFARAREAKRKGDDKGYEAELKKARGLMGEIANDKGGITDAARSAAIRLANGGDPQAAALAEGAGKVGASIMVGDQVAFDEKVRRRRKRLREGLGDRGMRTIERLGGGGDSALTQAFQGAMGATGKDYLDRMEGLARAAAQDPDKAAAMLAAMKREGQGSTDIGVVLEGAIRVNAEAKKFGLKEDIEGGGAISDRARRGIRKRLHDLGVSGKMKKADIDKLIRGEDVESVRENLKAQGFKDVDIEKQLGIMRGGMTTDEMREGGVRGAAAMGIRTMSEKVAKRAGLDPTELEGKINKKDSAQLQELKVHTVWFGKMNANLDMIAQQKKKEPTKDKKSA